MVGAGRSDYSTFASPLYSTYPPFAMKPASLVFLMILAGLVGPVYGQAFSRVTDAGPVVTQTTSSAWGSSWGDVNNDGFMDLFVAGQPNALHINNGDGTFTSVATGHAVTFSANQNSALWGDYDNDGFLDLYVNHLGPGTPIPQGALLNPRVNFLYRNTGPPDYALSLVQDDALSNTLNMTWTSSWSDYDNDGDLDLFVWGDQGDIDLVYENDGQGGFVQIEEAPFIDPGEFSAGGSFLDLDEDGDEDLFVVNFMRTNNELYRNLLTETGEVSFEPIVTGSIVTDFEDDLVPSWGDYDNDGDLDAFMAVWAGRNDLLFRNEGNFTFTRIREGPVVTSGGFSLGNAWLDYDNDGDLDLFVVDAQSLDRLFRNNGDGTFTRVLGIEAGPIATANVGFASGAAVADYDNDGDLDVFVPTNGGAHLLHRNEIGNANNWLLVSAVGVMSNRSAIGAKVRVKATVFGQSLWQVRYISGSPSGDRAQSSLRAHFGLGDAPRIDSLTIEWPSGIVDVFADLDVNQIMTATEGTSPVANEERADLPEGFALAQNFPNPFNPTTEIAFTLATPGTVTLTLFDVQGRRVRDLLTQTLHPAGSHRLTLDATALVSGTYFYRLAVIPTGGTSPVFIQTKALALVK